MLNNIKIRPITEQEYSSWQHAASYGFSEHSTEEALNQIRTTIELNRTLGAFIGGQIVGTMSIHSFEMTIPGVGMKVAYVDWVTVLPTHRRLGILTEMNKYQFRDMQNRNECVAALTASESSIYERFGYGIASWSENYSIRREHTNLTQTTKYEGHTQFVEPREVLQIWPDIYERVRKQRAGMFRYGNEWWSSFTSDPEHWRLSGSKLFHVVYYGDDGPEGILSYRIRSDFPVKGERAIVVVLILGLTTEAERELWRYCFGIDLMSSLFAPDRPLDDQLPWILTNPRRLTRSVKDHLWVRLVDASAALSSRNYATECTVVLQVTDRVCPWNEGCFKLETHNTGAIYEPSTLSPHVTLTTSELGAVYLGGTTFDTLERAGRVHEHKTGAVRSLDQAFVTNSLPWTFEF